MEEGQYWSKVQNPNNGIWRKDRKTIGEDIIK